jgi:hypothetical protein
VAPFNASFIYFSCSELRQPDTPPIFNKHNMDGSGTLFAPEAARVLQGMVKYNLTYQLH